MTDHVQNFLDSSYRRYAMKQAHAIPSVGVFGPFPSSFMLTPLHGMHHPQCDGRGRSVQLTPSRVSSTPPPSEVPLGGFPSHGSHTIPLLHDRFLEMSPRGIG